MKAIKKVSAVQQVEDSIKKYIMTNDVKIGDKLPTEKQLCEQLNVGRGTIREAIRLLQAKGFVEIIPGRGSFVAQTKEPEREDIAKWFRKNEIEIKDIIDVRAAIEPLAVKLAVEKCSNLDIIKLCEIQAQSVAAAKDNNASMLALLDEQFHSFIMDCSQNKILIYINKKIISTLSAFRGRTFNIPNNVQNFIPAHAAIIDAFKKRDVNMAQRNMIAHLNCVYSDLEQSKNL